MILLLRALARLVGFLLTVLLAVAGLAVAVFCIQGGKSGLSLPKLAELVQLPALSRSVDTLLRSAEASGPTALVTALSGAGAILLGLALLIGALVARRERLLTIADGDKGRLGVRRRALAQIAVAQVEQSREALHAKASVRPARRGKGGRLRVTSYHPETVSDKAAVTAADGQLRSLAQELSLRVRARGRVPRRGQRRVG